MLTLDTHIHVYATQLECISISTFSSPGLLRISVFRYFVAACCSVLHLIKTRIFTTPYRWPPNVECVHIMFVAVCCGVLQCVAACCT